MQQFQQLPQLSAGDTPENGLRLQNLLLKKLGKKVSPSVSSSIRLAQLISQGKRQMTCVASRRYLCCLCCGTCAVCAAVPVPVVASNICCRAPVPLPPPPPPGGGVGKSRGGGGGGGPAPGVSKRCFSAVSTTPHHPTPRGGAVRDPSGAKLPPRGGLATHSNYTQQLVRTAV